MRRFLRLVVGTVLALHVCASARAHDPLQGTLALRTTPDGLEITAVLSPPLATGLLPKPANGPVSKVSFPGYRAELLAAADRVCALLDANGKRIAPVRVFVTLNPEGEVAFLLEYPASVAPASVRVDLLASLGAGYFFEVTDHRSAPPHRLSLVRGKTSAALP